MGKPSWLIVILVFLFEITAFGLALGAMTRRSKASLEPTLAEGEYCSYTSTVATGLAAGAIVLLIAGQAAIMGVTSCFCCRPKRDRGQGRQIPVIILCILTWFCFAIAEICLIAGARLNKIHTTTRLTFVDDPDYSITCKEVRKSVFAAGAGFTFLTLLFSVPYYLAFVKSTKTGDWDQAYKNGAPTISMSAYP